MRPAYLPAALSLRSVRRPLFRRGGFRRRKRLFVRPFGRLSRSARFAASVRRSRSARFAASVRRSRSRPARRPLFRRGGFRRRKRLFVRLFVAALSLTLGSPLRCGALARARLAASVRSSRSARLAALWRRSRSRPARRFGAALPLRSVRRFGAFLRRPRPKAVKKIKKISDRYFIFS